MDIDLEFQKTNLRIRIRILEILSLYVCVCVCVCVCVRVCQFLSKTNSFEFSYQISQKMDLGLEIQKTNVEIRIILEQF